MSAGKLDRLFALLADHHRGQSPPFESHQDLYAKIDTIKSGDVPWGSFGVQWNGEDAPWKSETFKVLYQDPLEVMEQQFSNPEFDGHIDYAAKQVYDANDERCYTDLCSGNFAWRQSVGVCYSRVHIPCSPFCTFRLKSRIKTVPMRGPYSLQSSLAATRPRSL